VLLRRRIWPDTDYINDNSYTEVDPGQPLEGMMLWLERVKKGDV
jgi:hypothetical protein